MKNKKKRELLFSLSKDKGDFRVETFKSGGKGGQHQNKTDSGARVIHVASGLSAESRTERSQKQNIKLAFRRLTQKKEFQTWLKLEASRQEGTHARIEEQVNLAMGENNIKTEIKKDGKWVTVE